MRNMSRVSSENLTWSATFPTIITFKFLDKIQLIAFLETYEKEINKYACVYAVYISWLAEALVWKRLINQGTSCRERFMIGLLSSGGLTSGESLCDRTMELLSLSRTLTTVSASTKALISPSTRLHSSWSSGSYVVVYSSGNAPSVHLRWEQIFDN